MRVIAVDWSGRATGAARHIWAASVHDGGPLELAGGRDREAVVGWLAAAARTTPELYVGLDFSFSLPSWFLAERALSTAGDLWALAATDGERWLARCEPPFWGRPGVGRPPGVPQLRRTEKRCAPVGGTGPKSSFQIGGAGTVGTGSVRGMPHLAVLRRHGFSVWPFDPPAPPCVVEIYPRALTGPVVKRDEASRRRVLGPWSLPAATAELAACSEDALDAAVSALVMWERRAELAALPPVDDPLSRLEGEVWSPAPGVS